MKTSIALVVGCFLLFMQGCIPSNSDSAGLKHEPGAPTEANAVPPSAGTQGYQGDSSANGGLGLRAAAPYTASSTAPQNVNPGPFVNAGPAQVGTAAGLPSTSTLTRSADGTMSGPSDLPAATTGWGTAAATYGPQAPAAAAPSKLPTKKKAGTQ